MKEKDIDNLFREKLQHHETTPPQGLWENISSELDREQNVVPFQRKKSNIAWIGYAAAVLVLCGVGTILLRQKEDVVKQVTKTTLAQTTDREEVKSPQNQQKEIEEATSTEEKTVPFKEIQSNPSVSLASTNKPTGGEPSIKEEDSALVIAVSEINEASARQITTQIIELEQDINISQELNNGLDKQSTEIAAIEAEPVRPFIERFDGEEETMFAGAVDKVQKTVVNGVVDVIEKNVSNIAKNDVKLKRDEEGTISIDLGSVFARNRNKRR